VKKLSFDWMSNPQYLAQVSHVLGGALLLAIAVIFSVTWTPVLITLGCGVAAATFKEFVFDVSSWGEGDSWSDSFMDWAFYMVGSFLGMGLAFLHLR